MRVLGSGSGLGTGQEWSTLKFTDFCKYTLK